MQTFLCFHLFLTAACAICSCKKDNNSASWLFGIASVNELCPKQFPGAANCICASCNSFGIGSLELAECQEGYYSTTHGCQMCSSPCATCASPTICYSCSPGYYLANSLCLPRNCIEATTTYKCAKCREGYYLANSNHECNPCVAPCATCTNEHQCTSCINSTYFLSPAGICTVRNCAEMLGPRCKRFRSGYYPLSNSFSQRCTYPCRECSGTPTTCTACDSGYELRGTSCITLHCATFSGARCTACDQSYFLNPSGTSCNRCSETCAICSGSATYCLTCSENMTWKAGTRECILPECVVMSGMQCVECSVGYFVNSSARCYWCNPTCETCRGDANSCTSCNSSYVLTASSTCVIPNCQTMSQGQCLKCSPGYYLSSLLTCSPCSPNCAQCIGNPKTCTSCYEGYVLSSLSCQVRNCFTMGGDNCIKCISGYYLETPQKCKMCQSPCTECAGAPFMCTSCPPSFTLTNSQCVIPFCLIQNGLVCVQCENGYYLASSEVECIQCISPCVTCTGVSTSCTSCIGGLMLDTVKNTCIAPNCKRMDGGSCTDCAKGFYPDATSGRCFPCVPPCSTCLGGADVCTSCNSSYSLSASRCVVPDCSTMTGNACSVCNIGTFLSGPLSCSPCQQPCSQCFGRASACTACGPEYQLSVESCIVSNCKVMADVRCSVCNKRFYMTSGGMQCLPCTLPCAACSGTATSCTSCESGFSLDASTQTCVIPQCISMANTRCLRCADGYYISSDSSACLKCSSLCATCLGTANICMSCSSSYVFSSYSCIVQDCARMKEEECERCIVGYYLAGPKSCMKCQPPCSSCSLSATQCESCQTGYHFVAGTCIVPNCVSMQGMVCSQCAEGFFSVGNGVTCLSCSSSCATCNTEATKCTSCVEGYTLIPVAGLCFVNNCQKCTNGKCVPNAVDESVVCQCATGFVVVNNVCVQDRCGSCVGGTCQISANFTRFCSCGTENRLYDSKCVPNTCGICNNGVCKISNDLAMFACMCNEGYHYDLVGKTCVFQNESPSQMKNTIIIIVVCISVGIFIIVLIITLTVLGCQGKLRRSTPQPRAMKTGFEHFNRSSSAMTSISGSFSQNCSKGIKDFHRRQFHRPRFD